MESRSSSPAQEPILANVPVKLMPDLPSYEQLRNQSFTLIGNDHTSSYQGHNQSRWELFSMLARVRNYMDTDRSMDEIRKRHIMLGVLVFMLERIEAERWWGQGSTARDLIYDVLHINHAEAIPDTERLKLLSALREALAWQVTTMSSGMYSLGDAVYIAGKSFKEQLDATQRAILKRMKPLMQEFEHAMPVEGNVDVFATDLVGDYKHYKGTSANDQRIFQAQLIQAIMRLNPTKASDDYTKFSASYRIKMGILVFVMQSIKEKASMFGNGSHLYQQCAAMLNINDVDDLHENLQIQGLLALRNYVTTSGMATLIEDTGKDLFGDTNKLVNLEQTLEDIRVRAEAKAHPKPPSLLHPLSIALGVAGAVIAAPVARGGGEALGATIGMTNYMVEPNTYLARALHYPMQLVMGGGRADALSFYGANMMTNFTLQYTCGVVLQAAAMTAGFTGGAVAGICLFQITPAVVRALASYVLENHHKITDPTIAAKIDPILLQTLIDLPDSVYSDANKKDLQFVTSKVEGLLARQSLLAAPRDAANESARAAAAADQVSAEEREPLLGSRPNA